MVHAKSPAGSRTEGVCRVWTLADRNGQDRRERRRSAVRIEHIDRIHIDPLTRRLMPYGHHGGIWLQPDLAFRVDGDAVDASGIWRGEVGVREGADVRILRRARDNKDDEQESGEPAMHCHATPREQCQGRLSCRCHAAISSGPVSVSV